MEFAFFPYLLWVWAKNGIRIPWYGCKFISIYIYLLGTLILAWIKRNVKMFWWNIHHSFWFLKPPCFFMMNWAVGSWIDAVHHELTAEPSLWWSFCLTAKVKLCEAQWSSCSARVKLILLEGKISYSVKDLIASPVRWKTWCGFGRGDPSPTGWYSAKARGGTIKLSCRGDHWSPASKRSRKGCVRATDGRPYG